MYLVTIEASKTKDKENSSRHTCKIISKKKKQRPIFFPPIMQWSITQPSLCLYGYVASRWLHHCFFWVKSVLLAIWNILQYQIPLFSSSTLCSHESEFNPAHNLTDPQVLLYSRRECGMQVRTHHQSHFYSSHVEVGLTWILPYTVEGRVG